MTEFEDYFDNDGYQYWRQQEAFNLSEIVQKRIWKSQNPDNCLENGVGIKKTLIVFLGEYPHFLQTF